MTVAAGRRLRAGVLVAVIVGLVAPICAGLWETLAAAFGHLPAIGAEGWSLDAWRALVAAPGIGTSLRLTLVVGLASTFLSLAMATAMAAWAHDRIGRGAIARLIAPLLAVPHVALAIGLAFVLAPSGWIARALSPWATGWQVPPDLATVNDPFGLSLILGLVAKELPFFLLVMLAALSQLPLADQMRAGRALGYGRAEVWALVVLPQVYARIRLPVYAVLSFALSVVDVALILGPTNPPTLAVVLTRWFMASDTTMILPASAASLAQGACVAIGIAFWRGGEVLAARCGRAWVASGRRSRLWARLAGFLALGGGAILGASLLALAALALWSVTWRWSFPAFLPDSLSLGIWQRPEAGWGMAVANTLVIGLATTALALALTIAWLEGEDRGGMARAGWAEALVYLPLILPQAAFLYGLHVTFLRLGATGGLAAVIWAQAIFVFPYVMLSLGDPWRALDGRLVRSAAALGAGPTRRLWAVKLPILLGPVLTAAAIGFAVSVAQYLPTLFIGAGRVPTLTTEAVTLSSGSDRRVAAAYGSLQALLPLIAYGLALGLPVLLHRNRHALTGGAA